MSWQDPFDDFEQFWPHYLRAHSKRSTRLLHYLGAASALGCLAVASGGRRRRWLIWVAPIAGYAPAWLSHLVLQRNLPSSFSHPVWALRAGLKMSGLALTGGLAAELEAAADTRQADHGAPRSTVHAATDEPTKVDGSPGGAGPASIDPHSVN